MGDYTFASHQKQHVPSILQDMQKLQIPDLIKREADRLFRETYHKIVKSGNRREVIFACLYTVYVRNKVPIIPTDLAMMVGIDINRIHAALTYFDSFRVGRSIEVPSLTTELLLYSYCQKAQLTNYFDSIESLYSRVKDHQDVKLMSPQTAAAGLLKAWLVLNNIPHNIHQVELCVERKATTFSSASEKILAILRS